MLKMVEMGNGFPHGEHHLMGVEFTREKGVEQIRCALCAAACSQQGLAAVAVMIGKLLHSGLDPLERLTVRW